jgi:hypothetical protein
VAVNIDEFQTKTTLLPMRIENGPFVPEIESNEVTTMPSDVQFFDGESQTAISVHPPAPEQEGDDDPVLGAMEGYRDVLENGSLKLGDL